MAEIAFRHQIVRKQLYTRGTTHKGTDAMSFKLSSQSFRDGHYLFEDHILSKDFGFGCAGGNRSSHLTWSAAPRGTKSFAVTCHDPDAPTGSGFWHWLVVNITVTTTELQLDADNPQAGKKVPSSRFDLSNKGIWGAMSFSSTSQFSIGAVS